MQLTGLGRKNLKHIIDQHAVMCTGVGTAFNETFIIKKEDLAIGAGYNLHRCFIKGLKQEMAKDILIGEMFDDTSIAVVVIFDQVGFTGEENTNLVC